MSTNTRYSVVVFLGTMVLSFLMSLFWDYFLVRAVLPGLLVAFGYAVAAHRYAR